jgi:hypothetical protein
MAVENLPQRARRDEEVDVAIVGAGPSGSVAALHLAIAGFSVVVLEQGPWPDYAGYTGARPEHELVSTKVWHPNPNVRDDPHDYPIDTSTSDINPLMFAGVGGSATLYGAQWMHFLPSAASALLMAWPRTGPSLTKTCFHFSLRSSARSEYPASPGTPPFLHEDHTPFPPCPWVPSEGGEPSAWSAWAGIGGLAATPSRPRSSVSSTHASDEALASQAAQKVPNQQRTGRTGP